ncbi:hypothetical protein M569_10670 [Genlisea aurea]|uniref:GDSL esterase/lipase n=1 Tax=Genlisea aurea TaxID=192259 RepID=S8CHP1_9LAMI|nr:hypothetical protein M569_10670 [Genlisea aurea]
MASQFHFFINCFLLISGGLIGVYGSPDDEIRRRRPEKLFVFGDSYADTGNLRKSLGQSWDRPYGITNPGRPAGRFSDGLILTDYLGMYFLI